MSGIERRLSQEVIGQLLLETEPFLSCDECFDRLDAYGESLLAPNPAADPQMLAHVAACPACAEEADSLVALLRE